MPRPYNKTLQEGSMSKKWGNVANWVAIALALATFIAGRVADMPDWYVYLWVALLLLGLAAVARIILRILRNGPELEDTPPAVSAHGDGSSNVAGQTVNLQDSAVGPGASVTHIDHYHEAERVPPSPSPLHTLREPVADFTGREAEIDELVKALTAPDDCNTALISGIRGMGGVGKTELALVVARALAPQYPDAQIMLELQTGDAALTPEVLLRQVIAAFAPGAKLPDSLAELQAIYRDVMRGKRGLLLLDNARDGAQAAPLLPPPKGWAVIVTSRETFPLDGGCTVDLDVLPLEKAIALARGILRTGKRAAEGADVAKLAELCGRLPLALRLAADFLVIYKDWTISEYLKALEAERMKYLDVPGKQSVFASLGISVAQLEKDASEVARLWRLLGVFPAPFDRDAARAVWGDLVTPERDMPKHLKGQARDELKRRLSQRGYLIAALVEDLARFTLSELLRRSLLDWDDAKQEYYLHDLLREYALTPPLPEDWDAARRRHAAHYLEVGSAADDLYESNAVEGLRRFDAAWPHLQVAWGWMQTQADAAHWLSDFDGGMSLILALRLTPRQRIRFLEVALDASQRLGDKQAQCVHFGNLGLRHAALGDPQRAIELYEQALAIAREINDRRREGATLGNLGNAYSAQGDPQRAIGFYEQALVIAREVGDRRGEGNALGSLGLAAHDLGDPKKAIDYYEHWLTITRDTGDRRGEGNALVNLGNACAALGDARRATRSYNDALVIVREIGDRRGEGNALGNLGLAYAALGDPKRATGFYEQALVIACEIGDRRGEGNALDNLGSAYYTMGDPKRAIRFYERSLQVERGIGDRRGEASTCWNMGLLLEQQGDDARAAELMQACVDYERSIGHPDAEKRAAYVEEVRKKAGKG
jgi:tetratricopeptide (TPR) repeat protein